MEMCVARAGKCFFFFQNADYGENIKDLQKQATHVVVGLEYGQCLAMNPVLPRGCCAASTQRVPREFVVTHAGIRAAFVRKVSTVVPSKVSLSPSSFLFQVPKPSSPSNWKKKLPIRTIDLVAVFKSTSILPSSSSTSVANSKPTIRTKPKKARSKSNTTATWF